MTILYRLGVRQVFEITFFHIDKRSEHNFFYNYPILHTQLNKINDSRRLTNGNCTFYLTTYHTSKHYDFPFFLIRLYDKDLIN